jgi:hypothetical protein
MKKVTTKGVTWFGFFFFFFFFFFFCSYDFFACHVNYMWDCLSAGVFLLHCDTFCQRSCRFS